MRPTSVIAGLLALAAAPAASESSSTMIWNQVEAAAVYTSAGISRHTGTTPTFATSTWLNPPICVETFNTTTPVGGYTWQFVSTLPSRELSTFQVDVARHAVSPANSFVDTVAAQANFVPPSSCGIFGWNSAATATPVWTYNISNCDSSLLYDSDRFIDISDDGSTVAFSGFLPSGNSDAPILTVFNGQTGAVIFTKNLPLGAPGGPVQLSENGTYVAWTQGDSVSVYTSATGLLRDVVAMNWDSQAQISDSGDFLAFGGEDRGFVYSWNAASAQYELAFTAIPTGATQWYCTGVSLSSDGSGAPDGELVTYAFTDGQSLTARAIMYSLVTGDVVADYTSATNAKLQTFPTVRSDGHYAGLAVWGDSDDVPTAIVIEANAANPVVFNYTTPGSMFGVDLLVDRGASTPTNDVIYFMVAGKAVPANEMGNGGSAYAWAINNPA